MDDHERDRYLAWYDQLGTMERTEVDYIVNQLKGDFATAYLAVQLTRIGGRLQAIEERSPFRIGFRDILTLGTGVLAALGIQHGGSVNLPK